MQNKWACEKCVVATFDTKEECEEHERSCSVLNMVPCSRCDANKDLEEAATARAEKAEAAVDKYGTEINKAFSECMSENRRKKTDHADGYQEGLRAAVILFEKITYHLREGIDTYAEIREGKSKALEYWRQRTWAADRDYDRIKVEAMQYVKERNESRNRERKLWDCLNAIYAPDFDSLPTPIPGCGEAVRNEDLDALCKALRIEEE